MKLPVELSLCVDAEAMVFDGSVAYVSVACRGGFPDLMLMPFQLIALMGQAAYDKWEERVVAEAGALEEEERDARNGRVLMGVA